jgi:hypothetical protein
MAAQRKPDEHGGAGVSYPYARRWVVAGAAMVVLSLIVATGLWNRSPVVWILGIPGGLGAMALGAYFHRVAQRGEWERSKE